MCGMVCTRENFNQLLAENANLKSEISLLQEKVQWLMKKLFGRSSEKLSPDQLELELEELRELQEALELAETKVELAEEEQKESKRGKRKGLDARIPKDLPTETIIIDPDEVKANPELYKKIGEVRTEQLDVTPTRFFRTVTIRNKYKKRNDRSFHWRYR